MGFDRGFATTDQKEDAVTTLARLGEGRIVVGGKSDLDVMDLAALPISDATREDLIGRGLAIGNEVVYCGDSITNGVTPSSKGNDAYRSWAALLSGTTYAGAYATGGVTIEGWRDTYLAAVLARDPLPAIASVMLGTNNAGGDPVAAFATLRDDVIAPLRAAGIIVVVNSLTPRSNAIPYYTAYNTIAAEWCRRAGVPFVNHCTTEMVDPETGGLRAELAMDTVHPNAAGHKIIGTTLAATLKTVARPWVPPLIASDADTSGQFARPCFTEGFTDNDEDGLPDQVPPQTGLAFGTGEDNVTVTYEDATSDGVAGRWLVLERILNDGNTSILNRGTAPAVSEGDVIEWGCAFAVENAQADTNIRIALTGSQSSNHSFPDNLMTAIGAWGADIGVTRFYARAAVPAGFLSQGVRPSIGINGAAGVKVYIGQLTIRNLTALGLA